MCLEDRFAAMDLLAAGKTVNQVLEIMAEKHADWPMEKERILIALFEHIFCG